MLQTASRGAAARVAPGIVRVEPGQPPRSRVLRGALPRIIHHWRRSPASPRSPRIPQRDELLQRNVTEIRYSPSKVTADPTTTTTQHITAPPRQPSRRITHLKSLGRRRRARRAGPPEARALGRAPPPRFGRGGTRAPAPHPCSAARSAVSIFEKPLPRAPRIKLLARDGTCSPFGGSPFEGETQSNQLIGNDWRRRALSSSSSSLCVFTRILGQANLRATQKSSSIFGPQLLQPLLVTACPRVLGLCVHPARNLSICVHPARNGDTRRVTGKRRPPPHAQVSWSIKALRMSVATEGRPSCSLKIDSTT